MNNNIFKNTTLTSIALISCMTVSITPASATTLAQGEEVKSPSAKETRQNAIKGNVTLIILRDGINGKTERERITVPAEEAEAKKVELLNDPYVKSVEEDFIVRASATQPLFNDPLYREQTIFHTNQPRNMRLEPALRRSRSTNTIRVGVVDGGFRKSFDLNYTEGASFASAYEDDERGPKFYDSDHGCEESDAYIENHGHHVSHLIGATSDNALGMAGIARNTEVIAARALNCEGAGASSDISDSILWLSGEEVFGFENHTISQPVDIINISAGGWYQCPSYMQDAIDRATAKGITVVAAAGNDADDSSNFAPANCNNVIAVAASTSEGKLSDFTNTGYNIDTVALGSDVPSMTPKGELTHIYGTSFAAPIIAGIVSTVLSDRPNLTTAQLEAMIAKSGNPIVESPDFENLGSGSGILDAMKLMDAAGIPREIVAAQSVLTGERERYQDALLHPAAQELIRSGSGSEVCDLIEVDGRVMTNVNPNASLTVFSVPAGSELTPTSDKASIIKTYDGKRVIIHTSDIQDTSLDYGFARCDIDTGADCNQIDTIRGINPAELDRPEVCEATTVASR